MDIMGFTAVELGSKIKKKEIAVREALEAAYQGISLTGQINAYITVSDKEQVFRQCEKVQKAIDAGELTGPLAGVPFAVKDNLCTKDMHTTCASRMLKDFIPSYTAEAVKRLKQAGAIVTGKTNMDEFAMGNTTETSYYGETRNPWNTEYVPGGSSGGSCAAVAAKACSFALGTDTGGSIRQPASYCGVTGIKPTYGTVSRYGMVAYASSLDQIGPVAKDITDCAAILEVISACDAKDSTSTRHTDSDFTSALQEDVKGMRIGIPKEYFEEGLHADVRNTVLAAAKALKEKGAVVEECHLGLTDYVVPAYYIIASAEASSNLARFDGVKYGYRTPDDEGLQKMYRRTRKEGFGTEVKRRIMMGTYVLSAGYYEDYYLKALRVRTLIKQEFDKAFEKYDMLLGPVTPVTAPKIGHSITSPVNRYLEDIYTVAVNLAGIPAASVPYGKDSNGLPVGVQLIADCFQEKKLIRAAYTLEQTGSVLCPSRNRQKEAVWKNSMKQS